MSDANLDPSRLPPSLWAATATPAPATTALPAGEHAVELLVVGAGVTGLSAALHAAERGARVMVLEASEIGFGASGRNNGLVIPALTRADPDVLVRAFGAGAQLGIAVAHTSISEVVYHEGHWSLAYTNRSEHIARPALVRRINPTGEGQKKKSDQETSAEIEKIAQFYNQVALRLGHENGEQQDNRQQPAQDMSGEQIRRFAEPVSYTHLTLPTSDLV